jgi:hypothetical protein
METGIAVIIRRRRTITAAPTYSAQATAYFDAMSMQPDATRKGLLDTCISALVTAGIWAKLDWLSIMAAHDAQAARLNAITPAQAMTAVATPTFTTDRGYTGNGSSSYLDTGWNPSSASPKVMAQNSCSMFSWAGTNTTGSTKRDVGVTSRLTINSRSTSSAIVNMNSTTAATISLPASTSIGFTSWSRTGASASEAYKNGASIGTSAAASTALVNGNIFVCAANDSNAIGTPTGFSDRRIQAVGWGAALTAADHLALNNALATYMTAVGA